MDENQIEQFDSVDKTSDTIEQSNSSQRLDGGEQSNSSQRLDDGVDSIDKSSDTYLDGAIEAMLFVTDEPVSAIALARILDMDVTSVESALIRISEKSKDESSGIQLREVAGGWRLCTHPAYHDIIEKYVVSWDTRKLSAAAMETLAIIAYLQPVTRNSIASIRGVSSESSINSLIEKGLIKEVGNSDSPGNPILYGTTKTFLEKFGLRSTDDLVDISEFAPDEQTRTLIEDRLSSTKQEVSVTEEQVTEALAQVAGAVEKIDFDALEFDFDQE